MPRNLPPPLMNPVWPTMRDDKRPSCVFIVGDGFTQGFLRATELNDKIKCTIDDLIPAPPEVEYIPIQGDRFERGSLWDEEKWPKIFEYYNEVGLSGRDFFQSLPSSNINETREKEFWNFGYSSFAFELRWYIWHFFHYINSKVTAEQKKKIPDDWGWLSVLYLLISEFRFSSISFNYDIFLDRILYTTIGQVTKSWRGTPDQRMISPVEKKEVSLLDSPAGSILMLKPHGSIAHQLRSDIVFGAGTNPWLVNLTLEDTQMIGIQTEYKLDLSDLQYSFFPDLVPPGRPGTDRISPYSHALGFSGEVLNYADLVVICGLSGEEPDKDEVTDLLSEIRDEAIVIQVGLKRYGDDENNVANVIKSKKKYKFFDAAEVLSICQLIKNNFTLRWTWK